MKKLLVLAVLVFAVPSLALAGSCGTKACGSGSCDKWCTDTYLENAKTKLEYGVKNALTGWTEVFRGPKQGGCPLTGLFQGIYDATTYTVGGVVNLVAIPLPGEKIDIANDGVQHV